MTSPRVFIHGWGQDNSCWQRVKADEDVCLPLPGHHGMADCPAERWLDDCLGRLPAEPCHLIAWSLGGMLAMQLALQHPQRVRSLLLLATTPCFVQRPDWSCAVSAEDFAGFEAGIDRQPEKTLRRFNALMWRGDGRPDPDDTARPASLAGLQAGLQCLRQLDLRAVLSDISCPVLWLHGKNDAVTPLAAARFAACQIPQCSLRILSGGHALPWAHAVQLRESLADLRAL